MAFRLGRKKVETAVVDTPSKKSRLMRSSGDGFLANRTPRERLLIISAMALAVFVLLFLLVYLPLSQGINKLQKNIPKHQAEASQARALAQKIQTLKGAGAQATTPQACSLMTIRSLIPADLIKENNLQENGKDITFQVVRSPYGPTASLLKSIGEQTQCQIKSTQIQYVGSPAIVNFKIVWTEAL